MSQYEEAHKEHINKYKMAHCIGVAEYMRENAPKYGLDADAMYVLGLLHDIGYLSGRRGHEQAGEEILEKIGLNETTLYAVANHGKNLYEVEAQFQSKGGVGLLAQRPELVLMCEADMSVNAQGFRVGFDKRLEDIAGRYGDSGIEYATASATVSFVKEQLEKMSPIVEVYQLSLTPENHYYSFASIAELEKMGAKVEDHRYDFVYSMSIRHEDLSDTNKLLNRIYRELNLEHPADYTGHSLSVADVLVICDGKTREPYFVDSIGFKKLENGEFSRLPDFSHQIPYGTRLSTQKASDEIDRTPTRKHKSFERE
jgi:putative nucleotidyltransferase with HDIG domain